MYIPARQRRCQTTTLVNRDGHLKPQAIHKVFYLQYLPIEPSLCHKEFLVLRSDPEEIQCSQIGLLQVLQQMRQLRGRHQAGQIYGGPWPTAASCLAERETAKHLVPEQQAMDKKRTRMHLKLFRVQ